LEPLSSSGHFWASPKAAHPLTGPKLNVPFGFGELWHYMLNHEPYPDTYFDFPIT
jgi:hypothetical protein